MIYKTNFCLPLWSNRKAAENSVIYITHFCLPLWSNRKAADNSVIYITNFCVPLWSNRKAAGNSVIHITNFCLPLRSNRKAAENSDTLYSNMFVINVKRNQCGLWLILRWIAFLGIPLITSIFVHVMAWCRDQCWPRQLMYYCVSTGQINAIANIRRFRVSSSFVWHSTSAKFSTLYGSRQLPTTRMKHFLEIFIGYTKANHFQKVQVYDYIGTYFLWQ